MRLGAMSHQIPVTAGADPILDRIARAADLGLTLLVIFPREEAWPDADYLARVDETARRRGRAT